MDATELLKRDHQEVTKLFQRFQGARDERTRKSTAEKVCAELLAHTTVEEEIFYPAVREAGDPELGQKVDEAIAEHRRVKEQIQALQSGQMGAEIESAMTTMQQDVEHHVSEEEGQMFPRVVELFDEQERAALGQRLQERKHALVGARPRAARGGAGGRRAAAGGGRSRTAQRRGKAAGGKAAKGRGKAAGRKSAARKSGGAKQQKRARGGGRGR
jgi:hemerythrin superfamily protein